MASLIYDLIIVDQENFAYVCLFSDKRKQKILREQEKKKSDLLLC